MADTTDQSDGGSEKTSSVNPIEVAGRSRGAWVFLIAATLVALIADLGSKSLAFRHVSDQPVHVDREEVVELMAAGGNLQQLIPPTDPVTVIPSILDFQLVLNSGAVFGTGSGRRWFFVTFTVFALGFATFFFARWTSRRDRTTHAAIALVISGGIGNMYDRLVFGCVRDFIHPFPDVQLPFGLAWPNSGSTELWPYVSNVADAFLLIGIGVLMIRLWGKDTKKQGGEPEQATAEPSAE